MHLEEGERLLYKGAARFKPNSTPGLLFITNRRLHWESGKDSFVTEPATNIKNHLVSKQGTSAQPILKVILSTTDVPLTFEFISNAPEQAWIERDKAKDVITSLRKLNVAAAPTSPLPSSSPPTSSSFSSSSSSAPQVSIAPSDDDKVLKGLSDESSRRVHLLKTNKELRSLHEQLVGKNVLTDDEFWESRRLALVHVGEKAQDVGLSNNLLSDVRPNSQSHTTLHYKLTAASIHQIFIEYPKVHKHYLQTVPDQMTEQEFWTRYFQSLHFHKEAKQAARATTTTSEQEDEFRNIVSEDKSQQELKIVHKKPRVLNPYVDISAEEESMREHYGAVLDRGLESTKLVKSLPVLRRYNRHSAIVMGGTVVEAEDVSEPVQKKQKTGVPRSLDLLEEEVQWKELQTEKQDDVMPLNLQDSRSYLQQSGANTAISVDVDSIKRFADSLRQWKPQPNRISIPSDISSRTNAELNSSMRTRESHTDEHLLPEELKRNLLRHFATSCELLRHFWSCYPITSKQLAQKLERVVGAINQLYEQVDRLKQTAGSSVLPILNTLNKAIEKYNSTKKAQAASQPGS